MKTKIALLFAATSVVFLLSACTQDKKQVVTDEVSSQDTVIQSVEPADTDVVADSLAATAKDTSVSKSEVRFAPPAVKKDNSNAK